MYSNKGVPTYSLKRNESAVILALQIQQRGRILPELPADGDWSITTSSLLAVLVAAVVAAVVTTGALT